jgi:hypothetical protein
MAKVQGEGDYEAARRYRLAASRTARKVAGKKVPTRDVSRADVGAERAGRERARSIDQDRKDAAVMKRKVVRAGAKTRSR